ncbi:DUF6033 family protein [Paenibacillus sp. sgz5001063]|uniref:DUF6033 family protein n=1 Tax=Paenibacillus sp. sgz5001063 TaxID=3242474 RepID=UPI0036D22485
MYNPITGIHGVSLTRPPQQQEFHPSTPVSALSFNETLAAVNAATQAQAERIKRKYGIKVRILTVSADGKESEHPGMSGGGQEIVIAPNILQQMAKDPVVRSKMYGIIDQHIHTEKISPNPVQPLSGGKPLRHSLIIHMDGTVTGALWFTPKEGIASKSKDTEIPDEQTEEAIAAAERRHAWETALPILSRKLLSASEASLQSTESAPNPVDGVAAHDSLQQIQLIRARRANKLL